MDPRSQEAFDEILKKSPESLSEEEVAFLRARYGYIRRSQRGEYKEILTVKQTEEEIAAMPPLYIAGKDQTSNVETVKEDNAKA